MALYGCAHTHQEHEMVFDTSIQHLATKSVIINRRTHNALQELLTELSNGTSDGVLEAELCELLYIGNV